VIVETRVLADVAAAAESPAGPCEHEDANGIVETDATQGIQQLHAHAWRVCAQPLGPVQGDTGDPGFE
jgi:hypothetical protein